MTNANEKRVDKRPILSDLEGQGVIGNEADIVLFIHRPSYYRRAIIRKKPTNGTLDDDPLGPDPDEGIAEIIVAKHRNGPTGTIRLGFIPDFARFTNLESFP